MNINKIRTGLFALGLIANSSFAGLLYNTSIKEMRVYVDGTVVLWTATLRGSAAAASCITTGNDDGFMFNPSSAGNAYNALLSTALTAKSTGSIVNIVGTSTCGTVGTNNFVELVSFIQIK